MSEADHRSLLCSAGRITVARSAPSPRSIQRPVTSSPPSSWRTRRPRVPRPMARGTSSSTTKARIPNAVGLDAICLPPQTGATRFVLFWRASIADGLDTANLENGVVSVRDRSPPHDHLMPQVFGETFRGEAIRLQIRENCQCFGAHQHVAALLLIHASLEHRRSRLGIRFSRGLLL